MKYFDLPQGRMPALGLGTWMSAPGEVGAAVTKAIEFGYRHIDCAAIYGNEAEIGQALADVIARGVVRRDQLWITSKLWNDAHAPSEVGAALSQTLSDLRLEYLDLYLVHWPVAMKKGVKMPQKGDDLIPLSELPLIETWKALEACVGQGKTRHIGVSNFSSKKVEDLVQASEVKPAVNQVELHPYLQQRTLIEACQRLGVVMTAYSPLGSKERPSVMKQEGEPIVLEDPTILEIASRHQASPAQVLIAWALGRGTSVIPKSTKAHRIEENFASAQLELSEQDMSAIAALDKHRRYLDGSVWEVPGSPYQRASLWDGEQ